ncbi:MAG: copper amine oxidase N-terminal domain-containing protein [Armatimonadetes bacterium]|nr:copper amine oxidase N-terminal domain-containing protein [Chloroflexota bacterium]MBM3501361.1 copper amine oxidase N-terminal domain-containing protein [Armatimonadota bacterium]
MTMRRTLILGILGTLLLASAAGAGEAVLRGDGAVPLALSGGRHVSVPGGPTAVQGTVTVRPRVESAPGTWTHFIIDGQSQYSTNNPMPTMSLDTTQLAEGPHTLRIDSMEGDQRVATTGDIVLEVANTAVLSQVGQAAPAQPGFIKLHHKKILREIVWFNGREGDLETHGTMRRGHILITLTDLMRHLGGTVEWGPPSNLILASRNDVSVRVVPGSATAYVNGKAARMPVAAFRQGNRTYVPIRAMCGFFGVRVDWDTYTDRAYVTYQMP